MRFWTIFAVCGFETSTLRFAVRGAISGSKKKILRVAVRFAVTNLSCGAVRVKKKWTAQGSDVISPSRRPKTMLVVKGVMCNPCVSQAFPPRTFWRSINSEVFSARSFTNTANSLRIFSPIGWTSPKTKEKNQLSGITLLSLQLGVMKAKVLV